MEAVVLIAALLTVVVLVAIRNRVPLGIKLKGLGHELDMQVGQSRPSVEKTEAKQ
jgi:hypothetical protein